VGGLPPAVAVAAYGAFGDPPHALAIARDGTVWPVGSVSAPPAARAPVQLSPGRPLAGAVAVAVDSRQSLAVAGDGTVWAWGTFLWPAGR
jgi:hypothetical protein